MLYFFCISSNYFLMMLSGCCNFHLCGSNSNSVSSLASFIRKYLNVQTSLQRPAVNIQFTKTDEEIAGARVAFAVIVRHCYI